MDSRSALKFKLNFRRGKGVGLLLATVFIALVYLFAWSPVFTAKSLEIVGAPNQDAKTLIENQSQINLGTQLARVEPRAISNRLSTIDWVKSTKISRNWINGKVTISLKTRIPVAIYAGKVLDASGALFAVDGALPSDLPVVSGPSPRAGLSAIRLFNSLPPDFRSTVTSLNALTESTFSMSISLSGSPVKVIWGANDGSEDISLKIKVFKALIALPENQKIKRVDLSAPHAPIVK